MRELQKEVGRKLSKVDFLEGTGSEEATFSSSSLLKYYKVSYSGWKNRIQGTTIIYSGSVLHNLVAFFFVLILASLKIWSL